MTPEQLGVPGALRGRSAALPGACRPAWTGLACAPRQGRGEVSAAGPRRLVPPQPFAGFHLLMSPAARLACCARCLHRGALLLLPPAFARRDANAAEPAGGRALPAQALEAGARGRQPDPVPGHVRRHGGGGGTDHPGGARGFAAAQELGRAHARACCLRTRSLRGVVQSPAAGGTPSCARASLLLPAKPRSLAIALAASPPPARRSATPGCMWWMRCSSRPTTWRTSRTWTSPTSACSRPRPPLPQRRRRPPAAARWAQRAGRADGRQSGGAPVLVAAL